MATRTQNTIRNVVWGNVSHIVGLIIKFISRTVFIHYLGQVYMGVNGLFSNVLGVLSFTELGLGMAMNFELYKPVAENDREKIKSLMRFYKNAYRVIFAVITVAGLALIPFLKYLIKDPGNVGNIYVYYLIYLFDTATSYLVSYKYSLVSAEQKSYVMTNINTVISLIQTAVQIVVMVVYKSFLYYLLVASLVGVASKLYVIRYFRKHYHYLDENPKKLRPEELAPIKKNVVALIVHKIGDVCVHQTDNILISAFLTVEIVGKISNYNYIILTVTGFLSVFFSSVIGSIGNLIALEGKEHQYEVFRAYRFVGFWLYGFCAIAYFILFQPFIYIWAGPEWLVDELSVALICLERYNIGHRAVVNNFKTAAGLFNQDKWCSLGQAIINLVVSILMVKLIGLPGIYVGTVVQGLFATAVKPHVLYKYGFNKGVREYYVDSVKYLLVELTAVGLLSAIRLAILPEISATNLPRFVLLVMLTAILPNVVFFLAFRKTHEFQYMYELFGRKLIDGLKRTLS